eukprot:9124708-Pyramimonas_sp.AAC.1
MNQYINKPYIKPDNDRIEEEGEGDPGPGWSTGHTARGPRTGVIYRAQSPALLGSWEDRPPS